MSVIVQCDSIVFCNSKSIEIIPFTPISMAPRVEDRKKWRRSGVFCGLLEFPILFLLLLPSIVFVDATASYTLSDLGHDVVIAAGVVAGIDVSQQMRERRLSKNSLLGEMLLGQFAHMSDLEDVQFYELERRLEAMGQAVLEKCGRAAECGPHNVTVVEEGFRLLVDIDKKFTEKQRIALKDTVGFRQLLRLRAAIDEVKSMRSVVEDVSRSFERGGSNDRDTTPGILFKQAPAIRRILAMDPAFTHLQYHLDTLAKPSQPGWIKAMDTVLEMRPVLEDLMLERNDQIERMRVVLRNVVTRIQPLEPILKSAYPDIDDMLDDMQFVMGNSFRASKHPLRHLFSNPDAVIREFETKFMNGKKSSLNVALKPAMKLAVEASPLLKSWDAMKFQDDINQKTERLRRDLRDSITAVAALSDLTSIYGCVKDVVTNATAVNSTLHLFDSLEMAKAELRKITDNPRGPYATMMNAYHPLYQDLRKLENYSRQSVEAIRGNLDKIPRFSKVRKGLDELASSLVALSNSQIGRFDIDLKLLTFAPDLYNHMHVEAIECLKMSDQLSRRFRPVQTVALANLKSGSRLLYSVVSAIKSLNRLRDVWQAMSIELMHPMTRRGKRDVAGSVTMPLLPTEAAKSFVNGAKLVSALVEASKEMASIEMFIGVDGVIDKKMSKTIFFDVKTDQKVYSVWKKDLRKLFSELPASLSRLQDAVTEAPRSIAAFEKAFETTQLLKLPDVDGYVMESELSFVNSSDVWNSLRGIGKLLMPFEYTEKTMHNARDSLKTLEEYFSKVHGLEALEDVDDVEEEALPPTATSAAPTDVGEDEKADSILGELIGLLLGSAVLGVTVTVLVRIFVLNKMLRMMEKTGRPVKTSKYVNAWYNGWDFERVKWSRDWAKKERKEKAKKKKEDKQLSETILELP